MKPQKLIEINDGINVSIKGSGDENSPIVDLRTPLNILETYAKRCKTSVEYEYNESPHRLKSSVYVIRGNLGGFAGNVLCKYVTNSFDIFFKFYKLFHMTSFMFLIIIFFLSFFN